MAMYDNKIVQAKHLTQTIQKLMTSKVDVSRLEGVIDIKHIPQGAIERVYIVLDDVARFKLTTDQVQNGDTVKVTETNKMYFVKDDSQLGEEAGYEEYTVGKATAIEWSGILNKPNLQEKSDSGLETSDKTVVGAINEVNILANGKANAVHTHTKEQIVDFAHNHDELYYTKGTLDIKLEGKEPTIVKSDAFNKPFGTTIGTILEGSQLKAINTNIELKQNKEDVSLQTEAKDVVGAINEVNTAQTVLNNSVENLTTIKQDKTDEGLLTLSKEIVGAINEVNNKTNGKANVIHSHVKSDIRDFEHNHNDLYYGKETIDGKLDGKLDKTGGTISGGLALKGTVDGWNMMTLSDIGTISKTGDSLYIRNNSSNKGIQIFNDGRIEYNGTSMWYTGNSPIYKARNGYCQLPNGLIIQWGQVTDSYNVSKRNVSLPTSFSSGNYSVCVVGQSQGGTHSMVTFDPISNSSFMIQNSNTQMGYFSWMAIGY